MYFYLLITEINTCVKSANLIVIIIIEWFIKLIKVIAKFSKKIFFFYIEIQKQVLYIYKNIYK